MRKVLYREHIRGWDYTEYKYEGFFHCWVVKPRKNFDSETWGIIELENGLLKEIAIDNIKFVNSNSIK